MEFADKGKDACSETERSAFPITIRWDHSLADCLESLGSERGIITKVEVNVALEHAIRIERGPAATAHIVALVGALPRELNARPAITIHGAAVKFPDHRDEAQIAEAIIIELDEAGLDQIDGLLISVVHLGNTPPAYDARSLGHAASVAARSAAPAVLSEPADKPPLAYADGYCLGLIKHYHPLTPDGAGGTEATVPAALG